MPFKEWIYGQQALTEPQSHWFDFQFIDQNGDVLVTAPYTSDYGTGNPPWTATVTTTEIDASGQITTPDVPIATYQTGFDFQTADAALTGGETGVYWTVAHGTYPASSAVDIDTRPVDSSNNPVGAPVTLVFDVDDLGQFRVGSLATGGSSFLVAYSTFDATTQTEQIHTAGFTKADAPIAEDSGVLETFSSPGYDAFGFGTLSSATTTSPSFVYLRALANYGSPDIGYETVGTNGAATSALTGVPLTYSSGSKNHTLYNWVWGRFDQSTAADNNLVIAALTGDISTAGIPERNLEVRILTAGRNATIDDVVPVATDSTNVAMTTLAGGNFVVGYTEIGRAYVREYNNTGDVIGVGSFALPQNVSTYKITASGAGNLLVAYPIDQSTALAYDIFSVSAGPIAYRADNGVTRSDLHLQQGDSLIVKAGGSALSTHVDSGAGAIIVQAGGSTQGSVLDGNFEELLGGAVSTSTIVNSTANQAVVTGATATGTIVNAGGSQSTSGLTKKTILNNGSYQFVDQSAKDHNATLNAGGHQWVEAGTAQGTHIMGGDQWVFAGGVAIRATISAGDQDVSVGGTAISTVVNGGTQYVENGAMATLSTVNAGGTFYLGSASTIEGLVVNAGGLAELSGDGQTIAASGSTGVALNGGSLVKESGTGTSLIDANVTQSGTTAGHVEVESGRIKFGGSLSGLLGVTGDAGTSAVFTESVSSGTTFTFAATDASARLKDASDFHGAIAGFVSGDTLDLRSILDSANQAPSLAYNGNSAGGMLAVSDGTRTANLTLIGSYAQTGFHLTSDGHGGTSISYG